MQRALLDRASQFPGQEQQGDRLLPQEHRMRCSSCAAPIFEQKVVDLIVSKANVAEKKVTREELQALVRSDEEHDHLHDHDITIMTTIMTWPRP